MKPIVKKVAMVLAAINLVALLYTYTLERYFELEDRLREVGKSLADMKRQNPNIVNAEFSRGALELTIDVASPLDKASLKESVISIVCSSILMDKALNINARFTHDVRFELSGQFVGSWLVFEKDCT